MTAPRAEFVAASARCYKCGEQLALTQRGALRALYAAALARAEQAERERDALDAEWKLAMKQRDAWLDERDEWKQRAEVAEALAAGREDRATWGDMAYADHGRVTAERDRLQGEVSNAIGVVAGLITERDAARAALASLHEVASETLRAIDSMAGMEVGSLHPNDMNAARLRKALTAHAPEPEST